MSRHVAFLPRQDKEWHFSISFVRGGSAPTDNGAVVSCRSAACGTLQRVAPHPEFNDTPVLEATDEAGFAATLRFEVQVEFHWPACPTSGWRASRSSTLRARLCRWSSSRDAPARSERRSPRSARTDTSRAVSPASSALSSGAGSDVLAGVANENFQRTMTAAQARSVRGICHSLFERMQAYGGSMEGGRTPSIKMGNRR